LQEREERKALDSKLPKKLQGNDQGLNLATQLFPLATPASLEDLKNYQTNLKQTFLSIFAYLERCDKPS
jgi:hypothetical protein